MRGISQSVTGKRMAEECRGCRAAVQPHQ